MLGFAKKNTCTRRGQKSRSGTGLEDNWSGKIRKALDDPEQKRAMTLKDQQVLIGL